MSRPFLPRGTVFVVWCAVTIPVACFYYWTATSSAGPFIFRNQIADYYSDHYCLLADGFYHGHLYLTRDPAPQLLSLPDPFDPVANEHWRFHDASLYGARYYLYFGPVPALAVFLPFRLFLDVYPSSNFAVFLFALAGYAFSCCLLWQLLSAVLARPGPAVAALAFAALGFAQFTPILLRRPAMYEVAISAAYCFLMAALVVMARITLPERKPTDFLTLLAGLLLGLLPGCRPHLVLAVIAVVVWYGVFLARERKLTGSAWRIEMGCLLVPIAICGFLLAWYNDARFGSMFEFGQNYQLTGSRNTVGTQLALANVLPDLRTLLFLGPDKVRGFPFFQLQPIKDEPTVGSVRLMPLMLIGCVLAGSVLKNHRRSAWFGAVLALVGCVTLTFLSLTGNSNARYQLDYTPVLWILALLALILVAMDASRRSIRFALVTVIVVGCLWSAAMASLLSVQGYTDGLAVKNPVEFHRIAGWFGRGR